MIHRHQQIHIIYQILKEQEQNNCSVLLDEVKEKMQILRQNGISAPPMVSLLHVKQSIQKLIVGKDDRLSKGENRKEIHMEPQIKVR